MSPCNHAKVMLISSSILSALSSSAHLWSKETVKALTTLSDQRHTSLQMALRAASRPQRLSTWSTIPSRARRPRFRQSRARAVSGLSLSRAREFFTQPPSSAEASTKYPPAAPTKNLTRKFYKATLHFIKALSHFSSRTTCRSCRRGTLSSSTHTRSWSQSREQAMYSQVSRNLSSMF